MALINCKATCEIPDDWRDEIRKARSKPEPFVVIDCPQDMFHSWNEHLKPYFSTNCPFFTRPIRVFQVIREKPGVFLHKDSFSGGFIESKIFGKKQGKRQKRNLEARNVAPAYNGQPQPMYGQPLPVSEGKVKDLKHLKKFCGPAGKLLIEKITSHSKEESDSSGTESENEKE